MKNFVRKLVAVFKRIFGRQSVLSPQTIQLVEDVRQYQAKQAQLMMETHLAVCAVEAISEVDRLRHQLAGNSPELHQALGAIEMNLVHQLEREFIRHPQG